jgi:cell division protein FtsZ
MAGKDRSSKASSSSKSVAIQQRPQGQNSVSDQERRNGTSLTSGRGQGDGYVNDDSSGRQNSEEALEIPKFFKKPVS